MVTGVWSSVSTPRVSGQNLRHQSLPPAVEAGECSLWVGWQNISEEQRYFYYKRKAE